MSFCSVARESFLPGPVNKVLILGGTREAVDLTRQLQAETNLDCIYSLAGVTSSPNLPPVSVRTGGFGGLEGLERYLTTKGINLVADATHPYSVSMTCHAVQACEELKIPYVRLERPLWEMQDGDQWSQYSNGNALASALPSGSTVFLTVGQKDLDPYISRRDIRIVARMIEHSRTDWPDHFEILLSRPGKNAVEEQETMKRIGADILVAKNSGGNWSYPKIEAARRLNLPVYFIERPQKEKALSFNQVPELARFVRDQLASNL